MNTPSLTTVILLMGKLLFVHTSVYADPGSEESEDRSEEDDQTRDKQSDEQKENEIEEDKEDRLAVNIVDDENSRIVKTDEVDTTKKDSERLAADTTNSAEALAKTDSESLAAVDPENDLAINDRRAEEEKAKFFMKAFGVEMPTIFYPHDMRVTLDRNITVVMVVDINPYSQEVLFRTALLMPFLQEYLLADPLNEQFGTELPETMDAEYLKQQGFTFELNMKYQSIDITSPVELRRIQDVFLRSKPNVVSLQSAIGKKPISGYVNMSHDLNIATNSLLYNAGYRANVNIEDWVVQSEFSYNMGADQKIAVSGGRVVKDFEKQRFRMTLGDNGSPNLRTSIQKQPLASGFQQTIFGVDVSQTLQVFGPTQQPKKFRHLVVVPEEARVDISINGRQVYSRILLSGKYDFQDFPFQNGRNNITFLVVGREGVLEETTLEYFHNPSLLPKGQYEYKAVSGMPYKSVSNLVEIDANRLTNLAYLRYGITNQIGATGYIQTVRDNLVVGGIGETAFQDNVLSMEMAYSNNAMDKSGNAIRLQAYSSNTGYLTQTIKVLPSYYALSLTYMSPEFDSALSDIGVSNDMKTIISPSMIWPISASSQVQATMNFQSLYSGKNSQSYRVRAFYRLNQWQLNLSLQQTIDAEERDFSFYTTAMWRPKQTPRNRYTHRYSSSSKQHSFSANIRPENNKALNYQWSSNLIDVRNISHNGGVQYQTKGHNMSARFNRTSSSGLSNNEYGFNYFGPRGLIDITHSRYQDRGLSTSMSLNTALAFVDRHWGISRPISNSFAILYPNNESMDDSRIVFSGGSILDKYSAAVFPNLGNYQGYELKIDSTDVPLGLDLGSQNYFLQGGLNSGQAIPVGKPGGIIIAQATLLKPDGEPLEMDVGYFVHVEDPELTVQFFTNRSGRLFVQGLKSGDYTIDMLGDRYETLTVTIPKDVKSPFDLGEITLTITEQEQKPEPVPEDPLALPPEDIPLPTE